MPHDVDSGRGLQNRIRDGEAEHCVSGVRDECSVIVDAVSVDGDPDRGAADFCPIPGQGDSASAQNCLDVDTVVTDWYWLKFTHVVQCWRKRIVGKSDRGAWSRGRLLMTPHRDEEINFTASGCADAICWRQPSRKTRDYLPDVCFRLGEIAVILRSERSGRTDSVDFFLTLVCRIRYETQPRVCREPDRTSFPHSPCATSALRIKTQRRTITSRSSSFLQDRSNRNALRLFLLVRVSAAATR